MRLGLALALVALVPTLAYAPLAHAQGTYDGQWRPGAQHVDVAIDSWGADCPPRPQSSSTPGGGPIHVAQSGDDLSFPGGHSTTSCWSDNPAVQRVSRSYSDGTWRVVCRTPPDDARSETGTYTLHATTVNTIEYREVTQYDWTLNQSHCTARLTTTQTYERVSAEPPPTSAPPPTSEPPAPPCTPGAPARVAMRPASATVAPGGRACFTARQVDANGCAIAGAAAATFTLRGEGGELHGNCFVASASSGSAVVVGAVGEMSAEATVTIQTTDLSDLTAGRTTTSATGDGGDATAGSEARVASRADATGGVPTWVVVASIAGLLLVLIAVVGLLTRGRKRSAPVPDPSPSIVPSAPSMVPATPAAAPATGGQAKICPICRRGYGADVSVCPKDNEPLVPYAEFVQRKEQSAPSRTCPKCGTVYPSTTRFCGKDGTTLG
jgi:hypothetical protein